MHIILSVLKIIGIVLLVLLAVLIVLLLVLLFAPVCYRAEGSYKENTPCVKAGVRFLFPLLQVVFSYMDGAPEGKIKVLGICVRDFFDKSGKPQKKKKEKTEKSGKKQKAKSGKKEKENAGINKTRKSSAESTQNSEKINNPEELKNPEKAKNPEKTETRKKAENPEKTETPKNKDLKINEKTNEKTNEATNEATNETIDETEKQTFFEKLKYYISFLKEKILSVLAKIKEWKEKGHKLRDRIDDISEKIMHYKKIWDMDVTRQAFKKAKKSLGRLWKSIKPGKGLLRLHIGTDDPAKTGEICAFFGMIYPFVGNYVMIEPDFERKIYEGDFFVKGHVTVFVLLRAAWVFLFDKDIKKLREILTNSD